MVMEVVQEDYGDGSMQCTDHPFKNNSPAGGICAFCLQEKLGKLVSSSFPVTSVFPSSSSSPSPSFRSDPVLPVRTHTSATSHHYAHLKKSKIPFLLTQKNKKNTDSASASASDHSNTIIFKRSKSSVAPRRGENFNEIDDFNTPHKRRFWSFIHLSKHSTTKQLQYGAKISSSGSFKPRERKKEEFVVVEENESPDQVSLDRKVSRSRSVGCGSRSFSGDFFERISTGFGDCTLRRVESQREGGSRGRSGNRQDCIKERVKCGGLFGGFAITSSSSSSSSSSYLVSSENNSSSVSSKSSAAAAQLSHGRSRSWAWALASPIRAFKPSSGKRYAAAAASASKNGAAPNLSAIPSLLTVRN